MKEVNCTVVMKSTSVYQNLRRKWGEANKIDIRVVHTKLRVFGEVRRTLVSQPDAEFPASEPRSSVFFDLLSTLICGRITLIPMHGS